MRKDMSKVIVERPRTGGHAKIDRRKKRDQDYRHDPEMATLKEPLRSRDARTKSLNENLAPLIRFLKKQVGRPWDKVRAEIGAQISNRDPVQKHVLDHVKGYVEEHAVIVNGVPSRIAKYGKGGYEPVYSSFSRRTDFYVCPKSGLLKVAKPLSEPKPAPPIQIKRLGQFRVAVMWNKCWHEAMMKNLYLLGDYVPPLPIDAILGSHYNKGTLMKTYGKLQYAVSLRPMRRAEIKRLP